MNGSVNNLHLKAEPLPDKPPARKRCGASLVVVIVLLFASISGSFSYSSDHFGAQNVKSQFRLGACAGINIILLIRVVWFGKMWQKVVAAFLGFVCGYLFWIASSYLWLKAQN